MRLREKRRDNILKAMREAKDYEMKAIWNRKRQELCKIRERRAYERLEHQARMVH